MLKRYILYIGVLSTLIISPLTLRADDRPPTPAERSDIENSLREAGYTIWGKIELDDGVWEVDDASKQDDHRDFDILINPQTMAIVRERENDRPPTDEERIQIEDKLREAGYTTWDDIELDDGVWEVDDARKAGDSREFDLWLDPETLEIIRERLDD